MRRLAVAVLASAVLVAGCGGGDGGDRETTSTSGPVSTTAEGSTVQVPDLLGLSRTEAEAALEAIGLLPIVMTEDGDQDDVISQTPAVGEEVRVGHVVTILVRCEPAPCPAPPEGETIFDPCGCLSR